MQVIDSELLFENGLFTHRSFSITVRGCLILLGQVTEHDRLIGNRNLVWGLGASYSFSPKWALSGSAFRSVWTEMKTVARN